MPRRALTTSSRGQPKSCAFCLPLMSNVRPTSVNTNSAPSYARRTSLRISFPVGNHVPPPPLNLKSRFARAVRASPASAPPALCSERATPSRARAAPLVKQGIQNRAGVQVQSCMQEKVPSLVPHELSRSCTGFCPSTSSVKQLVSKRVAAQRSWWRQPRPNPSVEGTAKRLRLLSAPHLER